MEAKISYDGNGTFNRLYNWQEDAAAGINIMADRMDNEMNGFADGLSMAFLRDGQASMQADADIGNFRLLRVADPQLDTDGVNKKWIDDNFLSSTGTTTISGASPGIIFEETDQIADLNKWRMKVADTAFEIEPLQSDGSGKADFGEFKIQRDINGTSYFVMNGASAEINVGDFRTDQVARLNIVGYEDFDTAIRFKRQNALGNASWNEIINWRPKNVIPNNGGSAVDNLLRFGDVVFNVIEYEANSSGRHDFFCGSANLDASIDSNGFYMFGTNGLVSTDKGRFGATIDKGTLSVDKGVIIDHGGSNAYIANMDVGGLQFRFGGSGSGDTKVEFNSDGDIIANGDITADGDLTVKGNSTFESQPTFSSNVLIDRTGDGAVTYFSIIPDDGQGGHIRFQQDDGNFRSVLGLSSGNELYVGNTNVDMQYRSAGSIHFCPGQTALADTRAKITTGGAFEGATHQSWGGFSIGTGSNQNMNFTNNGSGSHKFIQGANTNFEVEADGQVIARSAVVASDGQAQLNINAGNARVQSNVASGGVQLRNTVDNVILATFNGWNGTEVGTVSMQGVYNNDNTGTTNMVRVNSSGQLQRSTSLAKTKKNMQALNKLWVPGDSIDALSPIVFEAVDPDPGSEGQLYAGFTVEDMQKNYPVAVPAHDPVDYDIKCVIALAIAELQDLRARVKLLEPA